MRNSKRGLVLLAGFMMLFSSVVACSSNGETDLIRYTNDDLGYALTYSDYWGVREISGTETHFTPPPPGKGYISVHVLENPTLPFELAVDVWLSLMKNEWEVFTVLDSKMMQGLWDWYVSYDYVTEDGGEYHGETFFKRTAGRLYKVDMVGEKEKYGEYPFNEVLSTFSVVTE